MPTTNPVPQDISSLLWWVIGSLVPLFGVMAGVIVHLWRQNQHLRDLNEKRLQAALDKEQADNLKLQELLKSHTTTLTNIETALKARKR